MFFLNRLSRIYKSNKSLKFLRLCFRSRFYYVLTIVITAWAIYSSYLIRTYDYEAESILYCYGQSSIEEFCFDKPRCYNQTLLRQCMDNKSTELRHVKPCCYRSLRNKINKLDIIYAILLLVLVFECVLRFISYPRFDPIYDLVIIGSDCILSLPAVIEGDYSYFGIALPLRIGFFIADVEAIKPILYKMSVAVPPMVYIGMLFTVVMYVLGALSYIFFGPERNHNCEPCEKYFSSLQKSTLTMLQVSMFQSWSDVTDDLIADPSLTETSVVLFFYSTVSMTTLILFNLFYALVTETLMNWKGVNVPPDASTSFLNRVFMSFMFQFFEMFLSSEDRKKFEECEASNNLSTLKFWIFVNSIKRYVRNLFKNCFATLDNDTDLSYATNDSESTITEPVTASDMPKSTLAELIRVAKQIENRVQYIEEALDKQEKKM
ncbi:hypothetical protein AKO1_006520 [Acrasis kona]|uniref:Ion transport domain-containing protein n=1 Tax=Acrasis kona TaxID=1008807 RepID=A0AAW2ZKK3_9EUKA